MRKKLFTLLLAVAAGVGTMFAWDYERVQIGDLYYNLDATSQTAEVTSQNSSSLYWSATIATANIPSSVEYNSVTYTVTSIGNRAFYGSGLTSVTIPNSVTSIGEAAFRDCSGLTSMTIPNSVTSIGDKAFYNCSRLTSVTIPNSVTSIGKDAFLNCSSLTSVTIPNSVTSIGEYAFLLCSGLTSVTIPNSVTSIGNYAFDGCSGLTSVSIGNSVTSIGKGAFSGCHGLTSVTIPNSVTSIGSSAFYNVPNIVYNGTATGSPWGARSINGFVDGYLVYKDNTKTTLLACSSAAQGEISIPDSVTSIGDWAFSNCSGLTSVTIPNSVTSIGNSAFYYCTGLTSVTIPNSVTSIGNSAFYYCTGLTSVTIPNSVTSIGNSAFQYCTGLRSIYVTCGDLERVKQLYFNDNRVKYAPLKYHITGNVNIEGAGSVQLPQNECEDVITAIPNYGYHFAQWSDGNTENPRTIVLTQDTTFKAEFAIDKTGNCGDDNALIWTYDAETKTLTITGNGTLNSNYNFGIEAPTQMQKLVIGNEVTSIGDSAFYGMSTINHLIIGGSVATIGNYAFAECRNFDDITCLANVVPVINETTFANVGNKHYIYLLVPAERERAYHRDTYWGEFDIQVQQAEETTVTTNDVTVEPQDNAATVTWPTNDNAASYTIEITKDGVLFCTLTFNANGQLTGIAFAPSRDGQAHAPAAVMTANGLQFTVTGLNSGTQYGYNLTAKDANDQTVATYSGSFTTTSEGEATGIEEISSSLQGGDRGRLILINGQIFILRGDQTYTLQGQEVK